ncbi:MAG: hypothetical protein HY290_32935 [Planctomycetia bacterium]|nr:hypothetical protein [Planctomycetia bacterium]
MQQPKDGSYYLVYVSPSGKGETMNAGFVAADNNAAEKHARKMLAELGVSEGTLFKYREDGSGEATEICQVSIRRTGT